MVLDQIDATIQLMLNQIASTPDQRIRPPTSEEENWSRPLPKSPMAFCRRRVKIICSRLEQIVFLRLWITPILVNTVVNEDSLTCG